MPTTFSEGNLTLTFPDGWEATKYDDWIFYRDFLFHFQKTDRATAKASDPKAVDFLCFDLTNKTLWLIEFKDYRRSGRSKTIPLWDEVALKSRDTLAGVFAAAMDNTHPEHGFARLALSARKLRVVLHLEQNDTRNRLFPPVADFANVQQKLKKVVKPIDAYPQVVGLGAKGAVPWETRSLPFI